MRMLDGLNAISSSLKARQERAFCLVESDGALVPSVLRSSRRATTLTFGTSSIDQGVVTAVYAIVLPDKYFGASCPLGIQKQ
jgi:hypothetical protein